MKQLERSILNPSVGNVATPAAAAADTVADASSTTTESQNTQESTWQARNSNDHDELDPTDMR